jgi:hypothetical protein
MLDALAALEDGGDKLTGHAARVGADGPVTFGLPVVAVECGRVERQVGLGVGPHVHAGVLFLTHRAAHQSH